MLLKRVMYLTYPHIFLHVLFLVIIYKKLISLRSLHTELISDNTEAVVKLIPMQLISMYSNRIRSNPHSLCITPDFLLINIKIKFCALLEWQYKMILYITFE